jgi:uncharacterized protein (TIGR03067 family)
MAVATASAEDNQAIKKDMAQLQGEWKMASGSADGYAMPNAMLETSKRVCKGDETTVTVGGQLIMKAKFTIDPSSKPKTIDYQMIDGPTKGKKQLGIYDAQWSPTPFVRSIADFDVRAFVGEKLNHLRKFAKRRRVMAVSSLVPNLSF